MRQFSKAAVFAVALLAAASIAAAEPPKPRPVRLPDIQTPPVVIPAGGSVKLTPNEDYIVDSDVELMIEQIGTGKLSIVTEPGPLTIKTRFAGGNGKLERKEFKGKWITTVSAAGDGPVTLVIVPSGATKREQWDVIPFAISGTGAAEPGPTLPPPGGNPTPVDPNIPASLMSAVSSAWTNEATGTKEQATALAKAFKDAADSTGDKSITTTKAMATRARQYGDTAVGTNMHGVRRAIGDWINANVTSSDLELDDALRKKYKDAYTAASAALSSLK